MTAWNPRHRWAPVTGLLLLVLFGNGARADGQPSVTGTLGAGVDTTDRRTGSAGSTDTGIAPEGSLAFEYEALDTRLGLSYGLDAGTFASEGDWRFLEQVLAARYRVALGSRLRLHVGGGGVIRSNGDAWSSASYRGLRAFSNLEWPGPAGALRGGVRLERRIFPAESGLDHVEVTSFVSARRSFQTRTTVIGELILAWKRFDAGSPTLPVPLVPAMIANDARASAATSPGGAGHGGYGPGDAGAGPTSRGRSPVGRPVLIQALQPSERPGAARAVTLFGRVAQSLADRVAVSLELTRRDAGGVVAAAVVDTPELLIEDGVYDDPFASDATAARVGLKASAAAGRVIELGLARWLKVYDSTPAWGLDGPLAPMRLREDRVWRGEVAWVEPLRRGHTGGVDLDWRVVYTFMDARSTDVFHSYTSHRLRVGLVIGY